MPKTTFQPPEQPLFERIKGDFPFEVIGCEFGISNSSGKTRGCETMDVKLKFFTDNTFTKPVAQWSETFYFHESCDWKIHQFALAANLQIDGRLVQKGDAIDFTDELIIGLRGWAKCAPEPDKDKTKIDQETGKVKEYNSVQVYLTDKPKLTKHEEDPFA